MRQALSFGVVILLFCLSLQAKSEVAEPEGYRNDAYRGPVPETLEGAVVISTETAFALWKTGKVGFVDVMPRAPKPPNLPEGTIWRERKRFSIPGALWLPNVGYGELAEIVEGYFIEGLEELAGGDKNVPLVFFCLEECWMSWNAAKRAMALGYQKVFWFPDGTDGWTFFDYPTERLMPKPEPY